MKNTNVPLLLSIFLILCVFLSAAAEGTDPSAARLLYQGHGSLRIITKEGKVIYVDPYAGEGYDLPADLILISHSHPDHSAVDLIKNKKGSCQVIYNTDALVDGEYKKFDFGYAAIEAVQAGNNKNHDINVCVGWLITLSDGISIYATGDTSMTDQMSELAERDIHYAFFVCDGSPAEFFYDQHVFSCQSLIRIIPRISSFSCDAFSRYSPWLISPVRSAISSG